MRDRVEHQRLWHRGHRIATLLFFAGATAAAAGWLPTEVVSDPVGDGDTPRVWFDPQGSIFATYVSSSSTDRLSIRPADGSFGMGHLSPEGGSWEHIKMGFDANGNGIFTWFNISGHLKAAYRTAGTAGTFGTVQTISIEPGFLGNFFGYDLAVNPAGDAMLVWLEEPPAGGRDLKAAFRPAGPATTFGTIQTVRTINPGSIVRPHVFLDPAATAVAVWVELNHTLMQAFHPDPGGKGSGTGADFGAPSPIASDVELIGTADLQVAQSPSGHALLSWITEDPTRDFEGTVREPGELFGPAATIASAAEGGRQHVAIDNQGAGLVAWFELYDEPGECTLGGSAIRGAFVDPMAGFLAPEDLSNDFERPGSDIGVAAGPGGELLLTYDTRGLEVGDDPCEPGFFTVAARYGNSLFLTPPARISDFERSEEPWAAVDAAGNAFVVWETQGGDVTTGAYYESFGIPLFADGFETGDTCQWSSSLGGPDCD